jgi:hypothetical protein
MFVCMYVCMDGWNLYKFTFLNQTSHTSPPWPGRDRRVCIDPKFLTSLTFRAVFLWGPLQNHGHKMAAGATIFRNTLIAVIPPGVCVVSPTLRCRRRRSHPRQLYIRDSMGVPLTSRKRHRSRRQSYPSQRRIPYSGRCLRHVTDITFNWATGPSVTALYPSF